MHIPCARSSYTCDFFLCCDNYHHKSLQLTQVFDIRHYTLVFIWCGFLQVEGNNANADDAIMLDKDGYVSETNATNIVRH